MPVALIAVLAVVATALPVWQKRGYAIALLKLADQGRVQADASSALRDELERQTGDYNFALQKKYAFPAALQVVEDVTKLLPDDTWLTQLEMKTTRAGQGSASRNRPARRKRERRPPGVAPRGLEGVRGCRAALADDQDPAWTRRDLRSRRAVEAVAASAGDAAGRCRGQRRGVCGRSRAAPAAPAGDTGHTGRIRRRSAAAGRPAARRVLPPRPLRQRPRSRRPPPRSAPGPASTPAPPAERATEAPAAAAPDAADAPVNGATKATP